MPPASHASDAAERHLHPFSFANAVGRQVAAVFAALVVVFILDDGDAFAEVVGGLWLAFLVGVHGWARNRAVRYRLAADGIVVRRGVFHVEEQHIPYPMIQNVVRRRTVFHRVLDLVELRLESKGGAGPEVVLDAITPHAAGEIEALVSASPLSTVAPREQTPAGLALELPELVRLGLVTNRGWLVVACALPIVISDFGDLDRAVRMLGAGLLRLREMLNAGVPAQLALLARAALIAIPVLLTVKVLSVAMAVARFHGFRLRRTDQGWTSEGGLLDRRSAVILPDRIQRLCVRETWLARKLGRQSLACAMSASPAGDEDRLTWLVPLARPEFVNGMLDELGAARRCEAQAWVHLHPGAWRRRLLARLLWVGLLSVPLFLGLGPAGPAVLLLLLPVLSWEARVWARRSAVALEDSVLTWRTGSFTRQWRLTWTPKAQGVVLEQSLLDRWSGMATVCLLTAGKSTVAPVIRIGCLSESDARRLVAELRSRI